MKIGSRVKVIAKIKGIVFETQCIINRNNFSSPISSVLKCTVTLSLRSSSAQRWELIKFKLDGNQPLTTLFAHKVSNSRLLYIHRNPVQKNCVINQSFTYPTTHPISSIWCIKTKAAKLCCGKTENSTTEIKWGTFANGESNINRHKIDILQSILTMRFGIYIWWRHGQRRWHKLSWAWTPLCKSNERSWMLLGRLSKNKYFISVHCNINYTFTHVHIHEHDLLCILWRNDKQFSWRITDQQSIAVSSQ